MQTPICPRCEKRQTREFHTASGACKEPIEGHCPKCGHPLDAHTHSPTGGGDRCSECTPNDGCNHDKRDVHRRAPGGIEHLTAPGRIPSTVERKEPTEARKRVAGTLAFVGAVVTLLVLQKAYHLNGGSFVAWAIPSAVVAVLIYSFVVRVDA